MTYAHIANHIFDEAILLRAQSRTVALANGRPKRSSKTLLRSTSPLLTLLACCSPWCDRGDYISVRVDVIAHFDSIP